MAKIFLDLNKIKELYLAGWTDEQVARFLGLSKEGLHKWKADNEFGQPLKDWKEEADKVVEKSLYHRAHGYSHQSEKIFLNRDGEVVRATTTEHYPPDPTSMIFWLKNRQPKQWREKVEHQVSGDDSWQGIIDAITRTKEEAVRAGAK